MSRDLPSDVQSSFPLRAKRSRPFFPTYGEKLYSRCKDCYKEFRKKYDDYQREYYRKWYAKKGRKRAKNYIEVIRLWRKLNPEKCKTYNLVEIALKLGKIKRPKICEMCGEKRKVVAHHEDYNFPFKIKWLCYSCHKRFHNSKYSA